MKISLSNVAFKSIKADLLVVGVPSGKLDKDPNVKLVDGAMGGGLSGLIKDEEFKGDWGQTLRVPTSGKIAARWLLLVGLGSEKNENRKAEWVAIQGARAAAKLRSVAVVLPGTSDDAVRAGASGLTTGAYRYDRYFTGDRRKKVPLQSASLVGKFGSQAKTAVAEGTALGESINLARNLVNDPPNDLTPTALANAARKACNGAGGKTTVWSKAQIKKAKMELFLAVNRGSNEEPRFVHMVYRPKSPKKKVVFVGKGLTFDAGGLCLKPAGSMDTMKCDMGGAAVTIGIITAAARLRLPVEVHGILGCTENMLGGSAYRPGDVFKSREGKTVEIINTDAEGRLVLADCLSYAHELNPDVLVDHATLTGACMVALGPYAAGLYGNDDKLVAAYKKASEAAGESFWNMPLYDDLKKMLRSEVADLKHIGDRWGGSITAALFLQEFVGKAKWIHCDIAGPTFLDSPHGTMPKGGTGFGVATGIEFLRAL
ncbi:MAG: leucyl aminopeptidase [Myxococcales bacterium]|nr:leucyl aminopeptidase [Myxococcales bacterium]